MAAAGHRARSNAWPLIWSRNALVTRAVVASGVKAHQGNRGFALSEVTVSPVAGTAQPPKVIGTLDPQSMESA